MKKSSATVAEYVASLPEDRSAVIAQVLAFLRKHVPKGYQESIGHGMIWFSIPIEKYPNTYNKEPLGIVGLAAQKNYFTLHLMPAYGEGEHAQKLKAGFKAAGKKLDMGKACIRFRSPDDLELGVIGEILESIPPDRWIKTYESARRK